ncbi:hypothetical protein BCR43DRAFT_444598 [Syncephalastrum racemosum]|uniref:C2H2-type domain-containing protein n=1 Tax=Syncephalastrum racemosum TaxID=13706 RepID=A0A1X2H5J9_SYNRA|nr:hypothetical protein BCR43DRAFT_444598 [Syncephalastrum racemosum]
MSEQERKACQWAACDEKFQQVDELTTHVCKVHLSSRSVDIHCRWGPCTVTVDASEALFNHLSDHLGQRFLHICGWVNCGQRFETFDELTGHLSEDHVGTGKSRYLCEWQECHRNGKSFTQRQKVMRHIQTHTGDKPYQCTICKKRFSEANIMTQHMRIHTGEKPFRCPEEGCDRTFSISGALKIHRRTHTGERPFTCKYTGCNKKFAESSNLTKHVSAKVNLSHVVVYSHFRIHVRCVYIRVNAHSAAPWFLAARHSRDLTRSRVI